MCLYFLCDLLIRQSVDIPGAEGAWGEETTPLREDDPLRVGGARPKTTTTTEMGVCTCVWGMYIEKLKLKS